MTIKNISDVMLLGTLKKRPHVEVIGNYMSIDQPIREGVFYTRKMQLLDETHINMVRGLIKVRGLNPVHQQEQLVIAYAATFNKNKHLLHVNAKDLIQS